MSVSLTVQILAMGLTISQLIAGRIENFRTSFNPDKDQALITELFKAGCAEGLKDPDDPTKPFDIDPILKEFAKDASAAPSIAIPGAAPSKADNLQAKIAMFDFKALRSAYRQLCNGERPDSGKPRHRPLRTPVGPAVDLRAVIAFYNESFQNLPDVTKLKNYRFEQSNTVLDGDEARFTDMYRKDNRRRFVRLKSLPAYVAQAFISAEDKDFYRHGGVDMRGIMRAAVSSMGASDGKRAAGGSTIPQQMIKNIYKADDYTFGRKMREMFMATKAESILTKDEIIELYLNVIPLGRDTAGIETAAQVYFKKSASQLTISEAAFLAGINKGPNFYNPDKGLKRQQLVEERRQYVLKRMAEDAYDTSGLKYKDNLRLRAHHAQARRMVAEIDKAKTDIPKLAPIQRASAYYFVDQIHRQIKSLQKTRPELADYDQGGFIVHSTINPEIQRKAEVSIQNGLAKYERDTGRAVFQGAVGSITKKVEGRTWQEVMADVKADVYYDVHWPLAVVLPKDPAAPSPCGTTLAVGLKDGTTTCLDPDKADVSKLKAYDLVFARREPKANNVRLLIPPTVQGAMVVLENKTGRVLGMVGGFSYGASQLNRATKTARQPGSTMKPFTYLYALNRDYQPNTLISDNCKPIGPIVRGGQVWDPRNYDRTSGGMLPLRVALENSMNCATANAMVAIDKDPADTLHAICDITRDLGIYKKCDEAFPFILGAQPARLIDMAQAYATIANIGLRSPMPYFIDSIERDGRAIPIRDSFPLQLIKSPDRVSFYQVRRMMEGVVQRGTAADLNKEFGPQKNADGSETSTLIAAKTGTSESENDAWFIGFSNDFTVATWIGYDNPDNKHRRTLGKGQTGGKTAMPIGAAVLRYLKQTRGMAPLQAPPADIVAKLAEVRIDSLSGKFDPNGDAIEIFRREKPGGNAIDSWRKMLKPEDTRTAVTQAPVDGDERLEGEDTLEAGKEPTQKNFETPDAHYQPSQSDPYRDDRRVDPNYRALQQHYGF